MLPFSLTFHWKFSTLLSDVVLKQLPFSLRLEKLCSLKSVLKSITSDSLVVYVCLLFFIIFRANVKKLPKYDSTYHTSSHIWHYDQL